jgi:hypothetical protein
LLQNNIIEKLAQPKQLWLMPLALLLINLYAIYVHHISPANILLLFWHEIIFIAVFTVIKMLFSLDGGGWSYMISIRIFCGVFVAFTSVALLFGSVIFSVDGFLKSENFNPAQLKDERKMMLAVYIIGTASGFFYSGRFKTAKPLEQFIPFSKLVILVILVAVLSQNIFKKTDTDGTQLVLALAVLKYLLDMFYFAVQYRLHQKKKAVVSNENN